MKDRSLGERDAAHFVHGYTDLSENREKGPVVITRGDGVRVFDEDGKGYLEAASGMWCTTLGFGEQELVEAAIRQMRKLPYYHTLAGRSVTPAIELAEKLASLVPIPDARIFFAVSGSEANDFLIKFLWYYNNAIGRPKKKKVIARKNGFHGATIAATSLTGLTKNHAGFDLPLPGFLHTDDPNYYHGAKAGESPEEYATRLADSLE
ncbi:MAG: aminotransferase class III-fold pyridoxal phosphate-dependent enzyme, partial [Candidatus Poribacteria bacterium]